MTPPVLPPIFPRHRAIPLGFGALAAVVALLGPATARAAFTDVTAASGIDYVQHTVDPQNCLMGGTTTCAPEANAGGVAAADVDGDGWVDLFTTRLNDTDILWCNNRDGTFRDCTAQTGLDATLTHSNGAGFVDIDNDGDLDLYVLTIGDPQFYLYINDGKGFFTEEAVARGAAVDDPAALGRAGMSVGFGDYDRDGYIDMYTTEWRNASTGSIVPQGTPSHSRLLHNLGAASPGSFEDVTVAAGVVLEAGGAQQGYSVGFSVAFTDFDADGWLDLAVTCDYNSSRLYWNNGNGTFTDGTAAAMVGTDWNGMGSSFGDVDGDGDLDWFVTSIFGESYDGSGTGIGSGNRLYVNEGGRLFGDETDLRGVREGEWGWGTAAFDYDLDADVDLVMTNGYFFGPWLTDPMHLFENDGTGIMSDVSAAQGITNMQEGRGLVVLDYDRDGDLDIFVANNQTTPLLYRNDNTNGNAWLKVRLEGVQSNRDAIGARASLTLTQGGATQIREIGVVSQFLGHSERVAHFGLGATTGPIHELRIDWPSGQVQVLENVAVDQELSLREPASTPTLGSWGLLFLVSAILLAGILLSGRPMHARS